MVDGVFHVKAGAVFDKDTDNRFVAGEGGLVEGRGVGVGFFRIVPVGVLTGVEEKLDDAGVAELGGEDEGAVAAAGIGVRQQAGGLFEAAEAGGEGNVVY